MLYPYARATGYLAAAGVAAALAAVTALFLWQARRRPYLAVGWFWYLGMLVPVIGLVQVGGQAMADRYTYLPLVGIFVMLAWSLSELAGRWRGRESAAHRHQGGGALLAEDSAGRRQRRSHPEYFHE